MAGSFFLLKEYALFWYITWLGTNKMAMHTSEIGAVADNNLPVEEDGGW